MKPIIRVCAAGVLALAVVAATGTPAFASTEPVSSATLLPAPTGLTPDDTTAPYPHAVLKNVKLDWAAVAGTTGYRVQVGRDSTWSTEAILSKDVLFSEWTVPLGLPNSTYVWRVAALKGSAVGHWSSETGQTHSNASFTKGWRTAPVLNTVTSPFVGVPNFSWSPVADASGYELQANTDPYFGGTATGPAPDTSPSPSPQGATGNNVAECFLTRTRYTPASDVVGASDPVGACNFTLQAPGTTVYWRVRALDAIATDAVESPTKPKAQSLSGAAAAPTADEEPTRPSVAGAWSSVGSFIYTPSAVAGGSLALTPTASLASDPNGLCTIANPGSPQAEHATCRDVPTIRWTDTGAENYRLTLALDDSFTNVQYVIETPGLESTFSGALAEASANGSWYYAVQACDATNCGPVTTTPPSFSKVTPRLTLGANPGVSGEITLAWQSYADALEASTGQAETQDAFAYHVEVATTDHPYFDFVVDHQVVDEAYLSPSKSYGDGAFLWRVQPIDSAGNPLPWSLTKQFTRDATAPKVVTVSPSSGVTVLQPVNVAFSEPVTGVTAATLGLSPAVSHTVTVTSPTTATITPTAAMLPGATYRVVLTSAVKDLSGNSADPLGPTFSVKPTVDDSSKAISYGGAWSVLSSSSAVGGRFHGAVPTATSKRSATMKFSGVGVSLRSCLGPSNGYLDIYIDNVKKGRVSLYRSYTGCGIKVASITGLARTTHTIKLVGIGSHTSASKGNAVSVDYLTVTP